MYCRSTLTLLLKRGSMTSTTTTVTGSGGERQPCRVDEVSVHPSPLQPAKALRSSR